MNNNSAFEVIKIVTASDDMPPEKVALIARRFAEHLGLTLSNCAAFGDGLNDLSMVEMAGVGVAMANAVPEVKRVAARVTLSNDEDGVAAMLEQLEAEGAL